MNNSLVPAVILGSHTSGIGVIQALGHKGVPLTVYYYQKRDMGYVSRYVKESFYAPHPEMEPEIFIEMLISYAKKNKKSVLIPNDDQTLITVSKNKKLLEDYFFVAATEWEVTKKYIDKKITSEIATRLNIPSPKTIIPYSIDEVESYGRSVSYPCLVKPRSGHRYFELFRKKVAKVNNIDEMINEYNKASDVGIDLMLQELIPGKDTNGLNYNSYFLNDKIAVDFTANKIRISPPGFGVPCVVKSGDHVPEVRESAKKLLHDMRFEGYSCMEFKKDDRDGTYKLIELNGRNNRSTKLAVKCGLNFPWFTYNYLAHGNIPEMTNYKKNIYWIDETRDILTSPKRILNESYSIGEYLQPYFSKHVFAIFDINDLRPVAKRNYELFRMGLKFLKGLFKSKKNSRIEEAANAAY